MVHHSLREAKEKEKRARRLVVSDFVGGRGVRLVGLDLLSPTFL